MNTAIIIPKKIQAIQPKPTKTQILEALMQRALRAHEDKEIEKETKRYSIEKEAIVLVMKEFKKVVLTADDITIYHRWNSKSEAKVNVGVTSPGIRAIQAKLSKFQTCSFDYKKTKELIMEGLKAPNPLLGNEDAEKALDSLLATIMAPKKEAALITVDV